MGLFQTSVLNKYKKLQEKKAVEKAYNIYVEYFHNLERQRNILEIKEEGFQQKFLMELFVNVFDYVINPDPNYNLTTEFKNEKGAKKADGAILENGKALAVIELKSTKTKDLESIRQQAFDYKANQSVCVYVITSNFEKLRFYINNAVEFEEFNLFTLNIEQFELLYLCLHKDNLLQNIPLKIKTESIGAEESITKKFYVDYSLFKRELYRDLVKQNLNNEVFTNELQKEDKDIKLLLFKKSQKLIDRFLFIFFAEDKGLLEPLSTLLILNKWKSDVDFGDERPLYDLFKQYFIFLDEGRKGTQSREEIFAYNGGLFKPDPILDSLILDDKLLYKHTKTLSDYDFESQVGVNILGHIFENSLNEIEEITAEIEGTSFDKQKTKRKKDGVFYTPKYITKYIVDNTVGKLCEEKKQKLEIAEEDYYKSRKGRKKELLTNLKAKLDEYREWLLKLTILDPACGSGAFLNQALDFLIKEHSYIDELETSLFGGGIVFQNIENTILEKNIYGVDLNDESIEIAKLSLWLRTAQPRRKLNSLSNNIKCGNSLIDDPKVAGDKAFNWQEEFPQIFDNGGFDVVIGNPPYVRQELFKEIKPYLEQNFKCYNSVADLYTYFIEKGIELMNENGLFSFILPNKFLKATYGKQIRKVIKENSNIELILDFDDYPIFDEATTYPIIYVLNKNKMESNFFNYSEINKRDNTSDPISLLVQRKHKVSYKSLTDDMWNFVNIENQIILDKFNNNSRTLNDFVNKKIFYGIKTGRNEAFVIDGKKKKELINSDGRNSEKIKVLATGKEVKRNTFNFQDNYLLFTGYDDNIPELYPDIQNELDIYKDALIKRYDKGENYWNLRACAYYEEMQLPKIIYPRINNRGNFYLDSKGEVFLLDNNFFISTDSKSLLALLNSKLVFFYLKNICTTLQGGFYDFRRDKISTIPISVNFETIDTELSLLSEKLINYTNLFNKTKSNFTKYLQSQYNIEKLSKKLQNWHELEFAEFIQELNKAIKKTKGEKLSKLDEMDWMEVFAAKKIEAQALKTEIEKTDKEIDQIVYELYDLTEEEIKIVENK